MLSITSVIPAVKARCAGTCSPVEETIHHGDTEARRIALFAVATAVTDQVAMRPRRLDNVGTDDNVSGRSGARPSVPRWDGACWCAAPAAIGQCMHRCAMWAQPADNAGAPMHAEIGVSPPARGSMGCARTSLLSSLCYVGAAR